MTVKYFVWIAGLHGPQPQIWDEKNKTVDGKPVKVLADPIALNEEDMASLNELARRYSYV